jgi:hypothetical protein
MKKPVACLLKRGEMIVPFAGNYIRVDQNFTYLPSKSEEETLVPIDNKYWNVESRKKSGEITLNEDQQKLILQAFADRDKHFEVVKDKINKMSIKDISPLFATKDKEKMFFQLMLCLTYFKALPENQEFRNELGFALFDNQMCLIKKFEPSRQEEIIKLFRSRFIQGVPEELKKMIRICLIGSYENQSKKLLALGKTKTNLVFN